MCPNPRLASIVFCRRAGPRGWVHGKRSGFLRSEKSTFFRTGEAKRKITETENLRACGLLNVREINESAQRPTALQFGSDSRSHRDRNLSGTGPEAKPQGPNEEKRGRVLGISAEWEEKLPSKTMVCLR